MVPEQSIARLGRCVCGDETDSAAAPFAVAAFVLARLDGRPLPVRPGLGVVAAVVAWGLLSASLMGLPPEALVAFNHVSINTGVTKLVVGRGGTTLVSANEHAHLEEADPGLITYR